MPKKLPSIRMFLSHRYKSPEVNLYFFGVFRELAEIQFDVDLGTLATCVTRLERMMRDADAFIGIYPYPDASEQTPGPEQKRDATRYFRLELELAVRSRRPALVFYDSRYGSLLDCPPSFHTHTFDMREVLGGGGKPMRDRHRRLFEDFLNEVKTFGTYQSAKRAEPPLENQVGLLVPAPGGVYNSSERQTLVATLQQADCDLVDLGWPPRLGLSLLSRLERLDWVVVDIGESACATGVPALLHGLFYPSVRLLSTREQQVSALESTLFGGLEVGYPKDIVRWRDEDSLKQEVERRLRLVREPSIRITTSQGAEQYFRKSALRNQAVFLSYAGADQDIGATLSAELKKRFQKVFDYRDGTSIATGRPWLDEVFESLAASAIGIPLLSANYVRSENCLHEARQMTSRADLGKMSVLPVKLRQEDFALPEWGQAAQYARYWEYESAAALVEWLAQCYDKANQTNKGKL